MCYNGFVKSAQFFCAPEPMLTRRAVRLTQLGRHPCALLFRFLTPLESTLPRSLPFYTQLSNSKPFRINTSRSVDPKQLKVPLKSTLLKNRGRGGPLSLTRSVNQKSNKQFVSQTTPPWWSSQPTCPGPSGSPCPPASPTPCPTIPSLRATINPPHSICARSFRIGGCHE
jgi:hypothetical protein